MSKKYDVAAFIWPAYTGDDPRALAFWPEGYGEWQTVKNIAANSTQKPEGYLWDRKPLWGYVNEANPDVMEMEINCAYRHGVNVFIYDWYWYDDAPFLENCLNDGYLKAKNNDLVKFYLMWANHHATYMWDIEQSDDREGEVIWPGDVTPEIFRKLVKRWIEKYFSHPSYYKIDGKPVFMFYKYRQLLKGLGGTEGAREALEYFREEVKKAGFPGLHLQIAFNGFEGFDYDGRYGGTAGDIYELLGFDSVSHYNMGTQAERNKDYTEFIRDHKASYDEMDAKGRLYFPQVSVGWDSNPRYRRFRPEILKNNTPENIKKAFLQAKEYVDTHELPAPLVLINSWNEWTETSYLQPDNLYGYGYLEAVRDVFGGGEEE
ncbi:MAG: glycoside hydrolase family 99-like domain-containing protein [Clostridia bacterium]|nr:glycoside hydrolase family 99-like domain-containing protein [Clostridia bacterium]